MKTLDPRVEECIKVCYEAATACRVCVNTYLGDKDMKKSNQLCLQTIQLAEACAALCASSSDISPKIAALCEEICKICATECERFQSEICIECAELCRRCANCCETVSQMKMVSYQHS